jgi:hypothetical protein
MVLLLWTQVAITSYDHHAKPNVLSYGDVIGGRRSLGYSPRRVFHHTRVMGQGSKGDDEKNNGNKG